MEDFKTELLNMDDIPNDDTKEMINAAVAMLDARDKAKAAGVLEKLGQRLGLSDEILKEKERAGELYRIVFGD
ncbi:hypothetical protein AGMMS49936_01450 [Endomicrobiia bacterium]|nr:hypothetical protein AGMMS49936_01450 [Endomicrobiia bacterium]